MKPKHPQRYERTAPNFVKQIRHQAREASSIADLARRVGYGSGRVGEGTRDMFRRVIGKRAWNRLTSN